MQLHTFFDAIAFTCNFYGKKAKKKRKASPHTPYIKKINKRKKGRIINACARNRNFHRKNQKFNVKTWKKRKKKRKLK